jgi:para-nitrobenzyl esterase
MPAAKGLFHKAIVQSATLRGASSTAARQHAVALAICAQLGLKPSHLDALRITSAGRLVRAGKAVESILAGSVDMGIFVPAVDGASLHEHPFGDTAPELSADIPLLIGTNSDEMTLLLDRSLLAVDSEDLSSTLQRWSGIGAQAANELVAQYLDMLPMAGPRDLLVAIATDYALRSSAIIQAEFKSQQCAPVYMYQFCWRIPACGGTFGATHGAEVPFIFGNVARATGFAAAPSHYRSLEKKMLAAWSSFARSGNPNHVDLPEWPVYSADDRSTMCFGQTASGEKTSSDECVVVRDPGRAGRLAMRAIDSHRRVEARQT